MRVTVRSRNARSCETIDHRAVEAREEHLEALEPGEVEVVRRLVEEQHVVAAEEDRRERRPRCLTAGEARERPLELDAEPELGEHGRRPRVEVGAAALEVRVERLGVRRRKVGLVAEPRGEPVHQRSGRTDAGAAREIRAERLARQRVALLRQMTDRERRRIAPDRAGVRGVEAREQASSVDLPAPFGPTSPIRARGGTTRSTSGEDDVSSVRLRDACGGEGAG